jgi:hypothetical protein
MCTKNKVLSAILAVSLLLVVASVTQAATEAAKQAAIDAGLAYLAEEQEVNGSWYYDGWVETDLAATGAALLAFIEQGHTPISGTAYSGNVLDGLKFLFTYAQSYTIGVQPAGNPDTLVNGIGVKFSPYTGDASRDIYATGQCLVAIAAVGTPGAVVPVGPQAGRTYAAVIQDTVDYLAYAQSDLATGINRGGWRYSANYGTSDNSTSQWPVVGLLYAQSAGATVPAFVATELAYWVTAVQNPDGGSIYDFYGSVGNISNVSRTGTLLLQQVFVGAGAAPVQAALSYLNTQWLTIADGTWNGNFGHPYAMWAAYKGLQVAIGLDDETVISNLHSDPGDIDNPNHGWNWWEDYCEWLVNNQSTDGSWGGFAYWYGPMATAWYINILAATEIPTEFEVEIDIKPGSFPNSINLKNKGVIPVAILTTVDFDAATVDPTTVEFAEASAVHAALEDVDDDGYLDMILQFNTQDTNIEAGDTEATLTGLTTEGVDIIGTDSIRTVPAKK